MTGEVFTFLIGGKAGEGVKKAGSVAARLFASMGREVFEMDDYQSLIRGGHNFSVISTASRKITSHYTRANLIVAMDKRSYELHKQDLGEDGIMLYDSEIKGDLKGLGIPLRAEAKKYPNPDLRLGLGAVTVLAVAVGMDKESLKKLIQSEYPRDLDINIAYATTIYDMASPEIGGKFRLNNSDKKRVIYSGNEIIALGAAAGGLDIYYAYPMTPSSSLMHTLAAQGEKLGIIVVHPENEIAVVNMAIGSIFAGAKSMVGSSGGGFALMQEGFSLAGMLEAPLLCCLASRPGPSTGVPTYTAQGDLNFAIHQGHGEFPRIVASPGCIEEAFYLTSEMLDLVWRFQTPGILLTEKHLTESSMTLDIHINKAEHFQPLMHYGGEYKRYLDSKDGIAPLLFPPSDELIKWNSYEHDETGITTENPELIAKMQEKRNRKKISLLNHLKNKHTVNIYGERGPLIFTYGSTTMSVREALRAGDIDATVVQPIYLEPLPVWELEKYKDKELIVVEQSCAGQFALLLKEKAELNPGSVIKKYDGRPFDPVELAIEIKKAVSNG
ncbi:MAG: 2-oxoacid:acceptor oxidoreductase subunit alpha [candidate division Zixibacteria bacterium]|nr:2-oxoacid:acceptor oxidoreductase subunit alpha [candidate division Zixibacteria bacterium]